MRQYGDWGGEDVRRVRAADIRCDAVGRENFGVGQGADSGVVGVFFSAASHATLVVWTDNTTDNSDSGQKVSP